MEPGYIATVFGAGLLSFFSPCILPVLPVYVAFLATDASSESIALPRRIARTLAFVAGLSAAFFVLGLAGGALGAAIDSAYFTIACGLVVIVLGLFYAGVLNIGALNREARITLPESLNKRSPLGAFLLGLVFSVAWTPCVGPVLASVIALSAQTGGALAGGTLLLVYAAGLAIPFVVIALASSALLTKIKALGPYLDKIKIAGGIALVALGLWMVFSQVHTLVTQTATTADTTVVAAPEEAGFDFTLTDIDGNEVRFADLRGEPVYVEWWATWCPTCMDNLSNFSTLADEYNSSERAHVLSVVVPGKSGEMEEEDFIAWAHDQGLDFPILLDSDAALTRAARIQAYPTSMLFASDGTLLQTWVGQPRESVLRGALEDAIANKLEPEAAQPETATTNPAANKPQTTSYGHLNKGIDMDNCKEIYFAGGCFWGVEEYFSRIPGVADATSGYANGTVENPTYEEVCTHTTGHTETVRVTYDPSVVSLTTLTEQLFKIINPLSVDRQGNDVGNNYRTGVYYADEADLPEIQAVFDEVEAALGQSVAVELAPLTCFYDAEEYHQDYLRKNPSGYCHISFESLSEVRTEQELSLEAAQAPGGSLDPSRYTKPDNNTLLETLTPLQYNVTQNEGTETAFTGEYWDTFEPGLYVDITTGEPLFVSSDKFESGCGWPSFAMPITDDVVSEHTDTSHGMTRTEVKSRIGEAHLGHVFDDGPTELGGLRYCIDSAALEFIPYADMDARGYGDLKPLCW